MLHGESTELWNVRTDMYSNHCGVNGYIITQTHFRRDCLWLTFHCRAFRRLIAVVHSRVQSL